MSIENIYKMRRQIRAAWDHERVPSKELIYDLLKRTLNIAPSKQNLFPFKIHAFGPENKKERDIVSQICCLYKSGSVNNWEDSDQVAEAKGQTNKDAPWVLVFELRKCKWNNFVKDYSKMHDNGQAYKRFTQIDEDRFRGSANKSLACVEIGMFIKLLAGLCLENELAISYIKSFPEWTWRGGRKEYNKDKNKFGLSWDSLPQITESPIIVVQIGYKANMEDILATNALDKDAVLWENKPHIDDIVQFKND